MCCAGGGVLSKHLALCCGASYSYFSSINKPYNKNNPEISGFGVWPKKGFFLTFFKEDYYV